MKVPVFCSLIPAELLAALGHKPVYLESEHLKSSACGNFCQSFHENICSYSKAIFDALTSGAEYDLIIVPMSCDAMKKLFNALLEKFGEKKLFALDVPRSADASAQSYFTSELNRLAGRLGKGDFSQENELNQKENVLLQNVAVVGSNVPMAALEKCSQLFGLHVFHANHCLTKCEPDRELLLALNTSGIAKYSKLFLERSTCPRMNMVPYHSELARKISDAGSRAIIVNSLKFCDFQPFDFAALQKEAPELPIIMIDNDYTMDSEGQTMTRLEAFFESLGLKKKKAAPKKSDCDYFVGIDSGSHATKLVCVDRNGEVVFKELVETGSSVDDSSKQLLEKLFTAIPAARERSKIIATGYGRKRINIADSEATEISCHALGAFKMIGKPATLIDIGGQDSKAIIIGENGRVEKFAMNDKCAAGTGRFLEVMSVKLGISLSDFAKLADESSTQAEISSMCSVFAESEVISLIASGTSKGAIAKGIHAAIAQRTAALAKRIGGKAPYYMAGGVAKNKALVAELSAALDSPVTAINEPQFSGALGAAISGI